MHDVLGLGAVAIRKMGGDRHGAVTPAGAADRHYEMRLPLGQVLGEQVVDQRVELLVEGIKLPVAIDERDDPGVISSQRAQVGLVVRVGQEADVEQQVRVACGART